MWHLELPELSLSSFVIVLYRVFLWNDKVTKGLAGKWFGCSLGEVVRGHALL